MKKSVPLAAVGGLVLSALATVAVAPAATATSQPVGSRCSVTGYIGNDPLVTTTKSAQITHATRYTVSPGSPIVDTLSMAYRKQLSVKGTYSTGGSVSTGLLEKIIGNASVQAKMSLEGSGSRTSTSSESLKVTLNNSTSKILHYVIFDGTMEVKGTWKTTWCKGSGSTVGTVVVDQQGSYDTYKVEAKGAVRCDLATSDAVDVAAKKFC